MGGPRSDPNAGTADPTDGRNPYDWRTRYPPTASKEIICEAIFLLVAFFSSLFLILATWIGWFTSIFQLHPAQILTFKQYAYYAGAGMLGGVAFGIKYFYRTVARGYWHQDRRMWRLMSPLIAMTVALIIGAMMNASLIERRGSSSGAASISIGFLVGYFADMAIGKMYEIATVIFGPSVKKKLDNGK